MSDAIIAETVMISGNGGDTIEAYSARPVDPGRQVGGVVVIHHMPGYDEPTKEIARTFAVHGYSAVVPNLYYREAPDASPDDAAAVVRAAGGVPDDRLVGDVAGGMTYLKGLPTANGKVGVIGYCSGGRQSFLAAVSLPLDAAVDCYGAFVVGTPPEGMPLKVGPLVDKARPALPAARAVRRGRQVPVAGASGRARGGAQGKPARPTSSTATRARGTPSSR